MGEEQFLENCFNEGIMGKLEHIMGNFPCPGDCICQCPDLFCRKVVPEPRICRVEPASCARKGKGLGLGFRRFCPGPGLELPPFAAIPAGDQRVVVLQEFTKRDEDLSDIENLEAIQKVSQEGEDG